MILNYRRELQIGLKIPHSQLLKPAGDLSHKPEIKVDLKAHLISTLHRGIDTTLQVRTIRIIQNLHIFIESFCKIYFDVLIFLLYIDFDVVIFSGHHQSFQQQPHQSGGSQFAAIQPHELANRLQRMGNQGMYNNQTW